jgi:aryl-alcohol dehydrogenase-like predicted oxidoreductase
MSFSEDGEGWNVDRQVVATTVRWPGANDHRNAVGLSRKTVEQELEQSLDRLGMDAVDLYQIHRWDDDTPIERTLEALDDAVRRGQVRYLGGSSMGAYQFADALYTSERLGLERFETMQNHYNLVYREEEREVLPLCGREGIGAIPWSPLGRGYLARPDAEFETTERGANDAEQRRDRIENHYRAGGGVETNERVQELAAETGVPMAQVALAWLLHQPTVDAPILGVSSVDHLEDAVEAVEVDLSESDLDNLEEPYEPVGITGH